MPVQEEYDDIKKKFEPTSWQINPLPWQVEEAEKLQKEAREREMEELRRKSLLELQNQLQFTSTIIDAKDVDPKFYQGYDKALGDAYTHYQYNSQTQTFEENPVSRQFQIECGQKVLNYLAQNEGRWIDSTHITHACGYATVNQAQVRQVLYKLRASGAVKLLQGGKNRWKINAKKWDNYNPFRQITEDDLMQPRDKGDEFENMSDADKKKLQGVSKYYGGIKKFAGTNVPDPDDEDEDEESSNSSSGASNSEVKGMQVKMAQMIREMQEKIDEAKAEAAEAKKAAEEAKKQSNRSAKIIEITQPNKEVVKLKNVVLPEKYEIVLALAQNRRPILLVGPAGCGKTFLGELIAKSLKMEFSSISCTAGMSESHLLGRSVPNLTTGKSQYQGTEFVDRYENGGVFLLDEFDAADPNMLLSINSAIANGYCNLPYRIGKPKALQHKDFVLIATANTYGRGATRTYAGRSQLDEATLDRFRIGLVEMDYDPIVERQLCPDEELLTKLQDIRHKIREAGVRRIISTRFVKDAYLMKKAAEWSDSQIIKTLVQGWTGDELDRIGYSVEEDGDKDEE